MARRMSFEDGTSGKAAFSALARVPGRPWSRRSCSASHPWSARPWAEDDAGFPGKEVSGLDPRQGNPGRLGEWDCRRPRDRPAPPARLHPRPRPGQRSRARGGDPAIPQRRDRRREHQDETDHEADAWPRQLRPPEASHSASAATSSGIWWWPFSRRKPRSALRSAPLHWRSGPDGEVVRASGFKSRPLGDGAPFRPG